MKERIPIDLAGQQHVLQALLRRIEALRIARQKEYKKHAHPTYKSFSQQELNDVACPTYKNWLVGRSHRIPSREMLLYIAEYLECTAAERAELLLIAHYLPELPHMNKDPFDSASKLGREERAFPPSATPSRERFVTLEIVQMRLKKGWSNEAFLQASDASSSLVCSMNGFLHRELLKNEQGQWLDLTYWRSKEEALAAATAFPELPGAQPFLKMIEQVQTRMIYLEQQRSYSP